MCFISCTGNENFMEDNTTALPFERNRTTSIEEDRIQMDFSTINQFSRQNEITKNIF
jgi:hypothetical protein